MSFYFSETFPCCLLKESTFILLLKEFILAILSDCFSLPNHESTGGMPLLKLPNYSLEFKDDALTKHETLNVN